MKDSSKCEDTSSSFVKAGLKLKIILKFFLHILKIPKRVLTSAALQIIVPKPFSKVCTMYCDSKPSILSFNFPSLNIGKIHLLQIIYLQCFEMTS